MLASLLAAPPPARALDPGKTLQQCTVQTWRTRDGMPGTWVRSIVQTDEGYLWIATYGGVARYDGERLAHAGGARAAGTAVRHHGAEAPGRTGRC